MIYLDYAATSLKRVELIEYIMNNMMDFDANADSIHKMGRLAKKTLENSRHEIAKSLNTTDDRIVFTSGASESNNYIINNFSDESYDIITSKIEHPSILNPLDHNKSNVILIDAQQNGVVDCNEIIRNITPNTKLIILQHVNNETGAIQPVKKLGEYLKDTEIWYHIDATQSVGHVDVDVEDLHCDSLSFSGHKLGGLNGFGVLYIRKDLDNLIYAGEQENYRRGGTSFVMGAFTLEKSLLKSVGEREYIANLKKTFIENIKFKYEINGNVDNSASHILNLYIPFEKNDFLLTYLDMHGICASAGSACSAGSITNSHVIENMYDGQRAEHSVRFSFGFKNTEEEILKAVNVLNDLYEKGKYNG